MHRHILVLDDDATLRNYIGTQLQRQNHRVSGTADGQGALAVMQSDRPTGDSRPLSVRHERRAVARPAPRESPDAADSGDLSHHRRFRHRLRPS